jgi:hypothetical protein
MIEDPNKDVQFTSCIEICHLVDLQNLAQCEPHGQKVNLGNEPLLATSLTTSMGWFLLMGCQELVSRVSKPMPYPLGYGVKIALGYGIKTLFSNLVC